MHAELQKRRPLDSSCLCSVYHPRRLEMHSHGLFRPPYSSMHRAASTTPIHFAVPLNSPSRLPCVLLLHITGIDRHKAMHDRRTCSRMAMLTLLACTTTAFLTPSPRQISLPLIRRPHQQRSKGTLSAVDANDLFQGYMGLIHTHPLLTKCATSACIVPLGDLSAQVIETWKAKKAALAEEKPKEDLDDMSIDWKRAVRFLIFGATLQPIWNHYYFQWFDGLIPPPADPVSMTNVLKVTLDQGIQAPIFTVIIFAYLDFLEGKNLQETKDQIKRDFWPCITTNWWVWIPITTLNYVFIPPDLRVLFVNVAFLGWCVFLSLLVNKKDEGPSSQNMTSET